MFWANLCLTHLQTQNTIDPFLVHLHSLLAYSHAHRAVLKLRDQKQLDLEELTEYLSGVTAERDRLSAIISGHAGSSGLGLSAYLRDKMNEAVTTAHETSDTFSNETLCEQATFQYAKEAEMKEMLSNLADGQIELYRSVSDILVSSELPY